MAMSISSVNRNSAASSKVVDFSRPSSPIADASSVSGYEAFATSQRELVGLFTAKLRRSEAESREFVAMFERMRRAKAKEDFDRYMSKWLNPKPK
jgi:hypothetical protein